MVGKDYIWEIDKPNRQIKYARNVVESGWVGSREGSTVNNSEVTVVATKGRSGKLLRAIIKDPKVKIETISRELLKGLGKEALDYVIPLIDPEAADWVIDAENNRIKYKDDSATSDDASLTSPNRVKYKNEYYYAVNDLCEVWAANERPFSVENFNTGAVHQGMWQCLNKEQGFYEQAWHPETNPAYNPDYDPQAPVGGSDEYKYIPIDIVSQQVIDNADSGHLESKEFLKSIPLFAYLLTGSGTEAVNKAVLDIDPKATDWILDPANSSIKYFAAGGGSCTLKTAMHGYSNGQKVTFDAFVAKTGITGAYINSKGQVWFDGASYGNNIICEPAAEFHIPIDTVVQQVISNAEAGHAPSQEALRMSTVERVDIGEYDEVLEAASIEIDNSWKYLPIYDVAAQVKRNSIAGHAESIEAVNNSLPFELPNYEPNITITGIAKVGEMLTTTVTDANGVSSNINYQWYADGEAILDATSETYVLKEAEVGKAITVKTQFTDNDGYTESVISPVSELVVGV